MFMTKSVKTHGEELATPRIRSASFRSPIIGFLSSRGYRPAAEPT
jgi:hypothetical protein